MLFVQTTAKVADDIVNEAKSLKELVGGNFFLTVTALMKTFDILNNTFIIH